MKKWSNHLALTALCFLLALRSFSSFAQENRSVEANRSLIEKYFELVINKQQLQRRLEFFALDYTWHQMNGVDVQSSKDTSHINVKRWLFNAIPDLRYSVEHIVVENDLVAVNTTASGIANREAFGLPVGKKKVIYRQMFFFRIKNNKIVDQWEVVDLDGIKTQLQQ